MNPGLIPDSSTRRCSFCEIAAGEAPAAIVWQDESVLCILDLYPATRGHALVLPRRHIESIYAMPEELGASIMAAAVKVAKVIKQRLSPAGLNLVQSNEAAAGQTVAHFHLHIVPRYPGDAVTLKFGHGDVPADLRELERLAALLRPS